MKRILLWTVIFCLSVNICSCQQENGATGYIPVFDEREGQQTDPDPTTPGADSPSQPKQPETTAPPPDRREIKMSFTGDCLIGSDYGRHGAESFNWYADNNEPAYFFSAVKEVFENDDITVVDCETVLSDSSDIGPVFKEEDPGYWYKGPSSNAAILAEGGVEIASVANNHTWDYGSIGFHDTVQSLADHGILAGENMKPIYYEVNGITVGVLCCNCWATYQANQIEQKIIEMNACSDIQVVVPHGGTMNIYEPEQWRINAFRRFIDAGAEVVAAGHPHTLQPLEAYNGGVIVYSLGNFCYGGSRHPENATVILSVTLSFADGVYEGLRYEVLPCYLYTTPQNNYKPELIPSTHAAYYRILGFMLNGRKSPK